MTMVGHGPLQAAFLESWRLGRLHHAWLLTGAKGLGKAGFARDAAKFLLSQGEGTVTPVMPTASFDEGVKAGAASLIEAAAHPDLVVLDRQINENTGNLARSITVDQVRSATARLGSTTSISRHRVIIVDSADDLEASGANALLKSLEEPPADTVFFLVSHNSGRLLPTIRSRCRTLHFRSIEDDVMASWLHEVAPDLNDDDRRAILRVAMGSPGRAMRYLGTGVSQLWRNLTAIAERGDADLSLTSKLSQSLALKSAGEDYEAFLELTPRFAKTIALTSDRANAPALHDHWIAISNIAGAAIPTSADKAASVFEICRLIAAMRTAGSLSNPRLAS